MKKTVKDFLKKKGKEKIVMVTAYDYQTAFWADKAGVDGILVGDSLGMVLLGYENTLRVTMEDMVRHVSAVARAKPEALIIADMPFMSYEPSVEEAVKNAGRLVRAGAEAVKLEGGRDYVDRVEAIVKAGIPVMGHVGLTPQRMHKIGGYRLMGKRSEIAKEILEDALALQEAGAFSIVVEFTAAEVAREITSRLKIPTIGIGSGPYCDGQVLVINDLLGLTPNPPPFAKKYADFGEEIVRAVSKFSEEVKGGVFPEDSRTYHMKEEELKKFLESLKEDPKGRDSQGN